MSKKYKYGCVSGSPLQVEVANNLNQLFQNISDYIEANLKPSRLASMALTSLEQAGMTAMKAVYHEGVLTQDASVETASTDCCQQSPCSA